MKSWNELSMAEKADVMKLAIEGGVYDLDSIRSGYNEYAKGGKIHIAPSKKGTFTAAASKHGKSVQAFASQVLAHPENYSPAMRKKANFARNASKWKHGLGGNLYEENNNSSAFAPLKNPIIPRVEEDQDAVNWIAGWYNNRREQLYNNAKEHNRLSVAVEDAKDKRFGWPIGKSVADKEYYGKLQNMANYRTATFEDLKEEEPNIYNELKDEDVAYTSPFGSIYYNDPNMDFIELTNPANIGFSKEGTHVHERTHSSGNLNDDDNLVGYNAQTAAVKRIVKLKDGVTKHNYYDHPVEIYARMMEFRHNHNLDPKKKYTSKEIQNMLKKEGKKYNSDLQRYDIDSLTKALNEIAQIGVPTKMSSIGLDYI